MSNAPFVRSPYNYDSKAVSDETGLVCLDPSLAQQQFADEGDPNVIMATFARTQDMSLLDVRRPEYGDFTGISDYQSALNAVIEAEEGFMQLSAAVRSRFNNDPGQLLNFLADAKNYDEALALGLLDKSVEDLSPPAVAIKTAKAGGGKSAGKTSTTSVQASNEAVGGSGDD